jgi:hypothetical protein
MHLIYTTSSWNFNSLYKAVKFLNPRAVAAEMVVKIPTIILQWRRSFMQMVKRGVKPRAPAGIVWRYPNIMAQVAPCGEMLANRKQCIAVVK